MTSYIPKPYKAKRARRKFSLVRITIKPDSRMPVISGQWVRADDGSIRAYYSQEQYAECLKLFELIRDVKKPA